MVGLGVGRSGGGLGVRWVGVVGSMWWVGRHPVVGRGGGGPGMGG